MTARLYLIAVACGFLSLAQAYADQYTGFMSGDQWLHQYDRVPFPRGIKLPPSAVIPSGADCDNPQSMAEHHECQNFIFQRYGTTAGYGYIANTEHLMSELQRKLGDQARQEMQKSKPQIGPVAPIVADNGFPLIFAFTTVIKLNAATGCRLRHECQPLGAELQNLIDALVKANQTFDQRTKNCFYAYLYSASPYTRPPGDDIQTACNVPLEKAVNLLVYVSALKVAVAGPDRP